MWPFLLHQKGGCGLVKVNGTPLPLAGRSLAAYLGEAGFDPDRVAVERNGQIVPRRLYAETLLAEGDSLEIVGFVGGG